MSKKIKVIFNEIDKTIVLEEDAQKGDYFHVTELGKFNEFMASELKNQIINDYKNSNDYKKLIEEKDDIKNQLTKSMDEFKDQKHYFEEERSKLELGYQKQLLNLTNEIEKIKLTEKSNYENQINELNNKLKNMEQHHEMKIKEIELLNEKKHSDELNDLNIKLINAEHKYETEKREALDKQKDEFEREKMNLEFQIDEAKKLRDKQNMFNTKALGEDFEK